MPSPIRTALFAMLFAAPLAGQNPVQPPAPPPKTKLPFGAPILELLVPLAFALNFPKICGLVKFTTTRTTRSE